MENSKNRKPKRNNYWKPGGGKARGANESAAAPVVQRVVLITGPMQASTGNGNNGSGNRRPQEKRGNTGGASAKGGQSNRGRSDCEKGVQQKNGKHGHDEQRRLEQGGERGAHPQGHQGNITNGQNKTQENGGHGGPRKYANKQNGQRAQESKNGSVSQKTNGNGQKHVEETHGSNQTSQPVGRFNHRGNQSNQLLLEVDNSANNETRHTRPRHDSHSKVTSNTSKSNLSSSGQRGKRGDGGSFSDRSDGSYGDDQNAQQRNGQGHVEPNATGQIGYGSRGQAKERENRNGNEQHYHGEDVHYDQPIDEQNRQRGSEKKIGGSFNRPRSDGYANQRSLMAASRVDNERRHSPPIQDMRNNAQSSSSSNQVMTYLPEITERIHHLNMQQPDYNSPCSSNDYYRNFDIFSDSGNLESSSSAHHFARNDPYGFGESDRRNNSKQVNLNVRRFSRNNSPGAKKDVPNSSQKQQHDAIPSLMNIQFPKTEPEMSSCRCHQLTCRDPQCSNKKALQKLRDGNARYIQMKRLVSFFIAQEDLRRAMRLSDLELFEDLEELCEPIIDV